MKSKTPDERFILALYEASNELQVGEDPSFDYYKIGETVGLQKKATETICKLLLQANFIKKRGAHKIFLTPHGKKLALYLLEEL